MSILSVTENYKGLSASDHIGMDGRITGSGVRYFDVQFNEADTAASRPFMAKAEGAVDPSTGVHIPGLGEAHPYDAWTYVLSRDVRVDSKSPFVFHVTVHYKEVPNPLDEDPVIEWLSSATGEVITVDIDGKAIANSSGEPVDPPLVEDIDDLVLRARYNVAAFNPVGAADYKGAVNSDLFLGFAPGLAKVAEYGSREIKAITGNYYVQVSVEIHFRTSNWKRKFVDEGYRETAGLLDDVPVYLEITDDGKPTGNRVSEPVKLDGEGKRLADGLDPVLVEYWTKPHLPFNTEFSRIA